MAYREATVGHPREDPRRSTVQPVCALPRGAIAEAAVLTASVSAGAVSMAATAPVLDVLMNFRDGEALDNESLASTMILQGREPQTSDALPDPAATIEVPVEPSSWAPQLKLTDDGARIAVADDLACEYRDSPPNFLGTTCAPSTADANDGGCTTPRAACGSVSADEEELFGGPQPSSPLRTKTMSPERPVLTEGTRRREARPSAPDIELYGAPTPSSPSRAPAPPSPTKQASPSRVPPAAATAVAAARPPAVVKRFHSGPDERVAEAVDAGVEVRTVCEKPALDDDEVLDRMFGRPPAAGVSAAAAQTRRRRSRTTEDLFLGGGMVAAWRQGPTRSHLELAELSEQRVLRLGLQRLYEGLAAPRRRELLTLPMRKNGSSLIMTPTFFLRLLSEELELKCCCASDVSASQRDLRYLDCDQLLAIRSGTLDFVTESCSHSAHSNFLASLDVHLFGKLAMRCLRPGSLPSPSPSEEALRRLSEQLALVAGATVALQREEERRGTRRPVPTCWAVGLCPDVWSGAGAALFHTDELQVHVLAGGRADFVRAAAGKQIAVVTARSSFLGRDKRLYWRVALHDPSEDILAEMELAKNSGDRQKQNLAEELGSALKSRCTAERTEAEVSAFERRLLAGRQPQQAALSHAT